MKDIPLSKQITSHSFPIVKDDNTLKYRTVAIRETLISVGEKCLLSTFSRFISETPKALRRKAFVVVVVSETFGRSSAKVVVCGGRREPDGRDQSQEG